MRQHLGRPDFWGWLLFLACAVLFIGIGVRDEDGVMIAGSLLFLAACVLFLVPYLR